MDNMKVRTVIAAALFDNMADVVAPELSCRQVELASTLEDAQVWRSIWSLALSGEKVTVGAVAADLECHGGPTKWFERYALDQSDRLMTPADRSPPALLHACRDIRRAAWNRMQDLAGNGIPF